MKPRHPITKPVSTSRSDGEDVERIYHEWDDALSRKDSEALLALYAPDAILESPLIPHLLKRESGICRGHKELRELFEMVAKQKPKLRQYYRSGYFTDGRTLIFEYPRNAPEGEQMDFVEVMQVVNGLIQEHKVYWGWRGVQVLQKDEYHT